MNVEDKRSSMGIVVATAAVIFFYLEHGFFLQANTHHDVLIKHIIDIFAKITNNRNGSP